MFEVLGKNYYLDVDKLIERCRPVYVNEEKDVEGDESGDNDRQIELNVFKYEIYKYCIERVLAEYEDDDDDMAVFTNKTKSPSLAISFNTLIKNKILIEDE